MVLVRQEIGDVLRDVRQRKGHTLRQVASRASVALGYLSEVERGQKEASSEILASVAEALEVPISQIMREVADRLAFYEGVPAIGAVSSMGAVSSIGAGAAVSGMSQAVKVPDTIPEELVANYSDAAHPAVFEARQIVTAAQARPRAGFVRH
jgi:DNA-binding XRE family transcriptional regulator